MLLWCCFFHWKLNTSSDSPTFFHAEHLISYNWGMIPDQLQKSIYKANKTVQVVWRTKKSYRSYLWTPTTHGKMKVFFTPQYMGYKVITPKKWRFQGFPWYHVRTIIFQSYKSEKRIDLPPTSLHGKRVGLLHKAPSSSSNASGDALSLEELPSSRRREATGRAVGFQVQVQFKWEIGKPWGVQVQASTEGWEITGWFYFGGKGPKKTYIFRPAFMVNGL